MAAVAPSQRLSPTNNSYRHHPYASSSTSAGPTNSRTIQNQTQSSNSINAKWQRASSQQPSQQPNLPPSPPRSRREPSETPSSIGLGVAFGGNTGGKWWDEELPAPPASLSSILDSFRRSGEGDRDLLLAILGAKKAEEERLTSLIQTRLTVLQARLSLHSAAAAVAQSQSQSQATSPFPSVPPQLVDSSSSSNHLHLHPNPPSSQGRTLSHRGSNASSPNSPPLMTPIDETPSQTFPSASSGSNAKKLSGSYWQHSTPSSSSRDRDEDIRGGGGGRGRTSGSERSRSRSPPRRIIRDDRPTIPMPMPMTMSMSTSSNLPSFAMSHSLSHTFQRSAGVGGGLLLPHPPLLNRARSHSNTSPTSVTRPTLHVSMAPEDEVPAMRIGGSVSPKTSDERGRAANGLDMLLDAGMGRGSV